MSIIICTLAEHGIVLQYFQGWFYQNKKCGKCPRKRWNIFIYHNCAYPHYQVFDSNWHERHAICTRFTINACNILFEITGHMNINPRSFHWYNVCNYISTFQVMILYIDLYPANTWVFNFISCDVSAHAQTATTGAGVRHSRQHARPLFSKFCRISIMSMWATYVITLHRKPWKSWVTRALNILVKTTSLLKFSVAGRPRVEHSV